MGAPHSCGMDIEYSTDSGVTWLDLFAKPYSVSEKLAEIGEVLTTPLNKADCVKTKEPGWIDPGTIEATGEILDSDVAAIYALKGYKALFRVTLPKQTGDANAGTVSGEGFFTDIGISEGDHDSDEAVMIEVTITMADAWTITEGS